MWLHVGIWRVTYPADEVLEHLEVLEVAAVVDGEVEQHLLQADWELLEVLKESLQSCIEL